MEKDKIKLFSKLYLECIKKDRKKFISDLLEENEYLNIILSKLISLRNKTDDDLVDKYTDIIIKIKSRLYQNSLENINQINTKLDKYYLLIIEKLCPIINIDLTDEDLKLFLNATNYYRWDKFDELFDIYNIVLNKKTSIDISNIDEYINFIKNYDITTNDEYKLKERLKTACEDLSLLNNIIF